MKMRVAALLLFSLGLTLNAAAANAPKGEPGGKGAAKEEEEPKIEGMEIARGAKGFLGLQILNGNFKLNFYDPEKEPVAPDVARALFRWDPKYRAREERVVLNPGGGPNSLTSERFIRPPYNFRLVMVLLKETAGGDETATETIVINFRQ